MDGKTQLANSARRAHPPTPRELAVVFFRYQTLFLTTFLIVFVGGLCYAIFHSSYASQMKVVVRHGRIDPAVGPTPTAAPFMTNVVTEEELNSAVELFRDQDLLHAVVAKTGLVKRRSWLSAFRRESAEESSERAVQVLAKTLVIQPIRKSQFIAISYHSSDPQLSADVLKALGDEYLVRQGAIQRPPKQSAFFEEQVGISSRELQRAQENLEAFLRTNRVGSATLERDLTLQRLSEAQASEFGLQASIAEAEAKAQLLEAKLQELPRRRLSQVRSSDNPQLQEKFKSKLLELELRRTQLTAKFQPSYRLVLEIDEQIAQTKTAMEAENLTPVRDEMTEENPDYTWASSERVKVAVELQALRSREVVARQQLLSYHTTAQQLARITVEQSDLEQKLKTAQDKYLLYVNKREEARVGDALDLAGILNIAIAQPPHVPTLPQTPFWLAACLSLFAAVGASTGAVLVANYLDPFLRTPSEVIALLGMPVLASLPPAPAPRRLRVV